MNDHSIPPPAPRFRSARTLRPQRAAHPKGKGAIMAPPDPRDYRFRDRHPIMAARPRVVPDVIDLRGPASPVSDQGQKPICVGKSAKILRETLHVFGPADFLAFSAVDAYRRANIFANTLAFDNGADPRSCLEAMRTQGICTEALSPDTDSDTMGPTTAQNTAAAQWRLGGYYACLHPEEAVLALAAHSPVIVTVRAGPAFDAFAEAQGYAATPDVLNDHGTPWNHEQALMGATGGLDPNVGWWLVQGTWGTGLFNQGYYCIPKNQYTTFFNQPWAGSLQPALT